MARPVMSTVFLLSRTATAWLHPGSSSRSSSLSVSQSLTCICSSLSSFFDASLIFLHLSLLSDKSFLANFLLCLSCSCMSGSPEIYIPALSPVFCRCVWMNSSSRTGSFSSLRQVQMMCAPCLHFWPVRGSVQGGVVSQGLILHRHLVMSYRVSSLALKASTSDFLVTRLCAMSRILVQSFLIRPCSDFVLLITGGLSS